VESSVSGGQALYTAVFVKGKPSDLIMRHGLTVQQHDAELAATKKKKLSPVNISVISIGGARSYTVLYRPESVGASEVKSQIPEAQYQTVYDGESALEAGMLTHAVTSFDGAQSQHRFAAAWWK
jgi:hypothetical protein